MREMETQVPPRGEDHWKLHLHLEQRTMLAARCGASLLTLCSIMNTFVFSVL